MKKIIARIGFIIICCSLVTTSQYCAAQQAGDTTVMQPAVKSTADTTPVAVTKPHRFQPNPKKAGLYSALLPGLGQLYNRQYWKIPVVYAGIGVAGYFFVYNLDNYRSYRQAFIGRINNNNPTDKYVDIYTKDQLQQLQNDHNKYLNLTVLLSVVGYTLQVLDAVTAAHLKNFDVSRDISMRMLPVVTPNGVGLGLVMNF